MSFLKLEHIEHSYEDTQVLKDINLNIEEGELVTLLGPSGCGKTTILRIIAGLLSPSSGSVIVNEADITFLKPEKRRMGMVFQNYALFPHMTVEENVAYGLKVQGFSRKDILKKVDEYLHLTDLLPLSKRRVDQLSGGQQQRVAIARALVWKPQILLLDEPLSNLDTALRLKLRDEIREIQQKTGITTIFVTHDQQEALSISDRIAVMNEGKILQYGTPEEIYNHPVDSFVNTFVGSCSLVDEETYRMLGGKKLSGSINKIFNESMKPNSSGLVSVTADSPSKYYLRPECLELSDWTDQDKDIDYVTVPGIVTKRKFMGAFYEYKILFGKYELSVLTVNSPNQNFYQPGMKVKVKLKSMKRVTYETNDTN